MRSAGHLVVDQLVAAGVPRVYSVPGESFLDVLDGLHDAPVHNVVARHEGGAGFMALAEARLTGRPGVVLVTRGPGAANAQIAVHTAWQDQTPLVLMVGLVPTCDRNRESFQEFDPRAWFGSTAKKVVVLDHPDDAARLVDDALYTAASGRPGPVVVGLPEDVLVRKTEAASVPPRRPAGPLPGTEQVDRLTALLEQARRPLVVVGGDGWHTGAGTRLADWAAEAGVPVASDFRAYDAVPHSSPAWVGSLGYGRSDALARRLDEADLLLFVGCVRSDVLSDGYARGLDATTVVVGPDAQAHGHTGRIDLQLVSTVAGFVAALPGVSSAADPAWLADARADHLAFATPRPSGVETPYVDLDAAMLELRERLEPDAVVTYGAGNHALWAARYLPHTAPGTLVAPRNGAMGVGVPAAVAASLVHPGRRVVTVAGDGCFLMNGQELATATTHGARVLAIVVDNGCYGTIREHQERHYPGRPSGTGLTNPDFAALGRAVGLHGETVRTTAELAAALDRALAAEKGAVVHLLTDPDARSPRTDHERARLSAGHGTERSGA